MTPFADLPDNQKYRIADRLEWIGIRQWMPHPKQSAHRRARLGTAAHLLCCYVAGHLPPEPCEHKHGPTETGHCLLCGKVWPTYGPERLPFP